MLRRNEGPYGDRFCTDLSSSILEFLEAARAVTAVFVDAFVCAVRVQQAQLLPNHHDDSLARIKPFPVPYMAILLSHHTMAFNHHKRMRRSATAVMAGAFDPRPPRDVLTSLLNGVGPYKEVERDEEARQKRKQEKKEQRREEKRKLKAAARARKELQAVDAERAMAEDNLPSTSKLTPSIRLTTSGTHNSFWRTRPTILIPSVQRSVSVTPSPTSPPRRLASTPASTPGPSISSSTSHASSKRPRTPDDGEAVTAQEERLTISAPPRKKRSAAKKGWKGWVEGSPPPSEKLINLDAVPILQDRRLRSGKNFDGIGPGTHGWV